MQSFHHMQGSNVNGTTAATEEQIIDRHIANAAEGFAAMKKIIDFCCVGCGLCASVCPKNLLEIDDTRKKPVLSGRCTRCGLCYLACPRSFLPLSKINARYFGAGEGEEQERLGNYADFFVSRSPDERIYREGTPGGTTTALMHCLLDDGQVDAALLTRGRHRHVRYCMHPEPYIATTAAQVLESSHSKFELSPVLAQLKNLGRYRRSAVVGTPCHILALRKLQIINEDRVLAARLPRLAEVAAGLTAPVTYAVSINCFLNHTSMDRAYAWLGIDERELIRFNENVSKELYEKAFAAGKDWRWFFRNNYVTADGIEQDYDVNQLGVRVLPSGCLLCNNLIVSTQADASIGFFGAETGVREVGWNTTVIMNPGLKKITDAMVAAGKLARRPVLRGYGRTLRKILEKLIPALDVMDVRSYLATGAWRYPKPLKLARGPRKTYILGLEVLFLGQTIRKKFFTEGPLRALKKAGAYIPTVY
jgi:coenzyme F420-reducing hydrogenase beta subunit